MEKKKRRRNEKVNNENDTNEQGKERGKIGEGKGRKRICFDFLSFFNEQEPKFFSFQIKLI